MHFWGERKRDRERGEAKQRGVDGRFCETNTSRRVGGREAGVRMKKWRGSERCREESETAQRRRKREERKRAQGAESKKECRAKQDEECRRQRKEHPL